MRVNSATFTLQDFRRTVDEASRKGAGLVGYLRAEQLFVSDDYKPGGEGLGLESVVPSSRLLGEIADRLAQDPRIENSPAAKSLLPKLKDLIQDPETCAIGSDDLGKVKELLDQICSATKLPKPLAKLNPLPDSEIFEPVMPELEAVSKLTTAGVPISVGIEPLNPDGAKNVLQDELKKTEQLDVPGGEAPVVSEGWKALEEQVRKLEVAIMEFAKVWQPIYDKLEELHAKGYLDTKAPAAHEKATALLKELGFVRNGDGVFGSAVKFAQDPAAAAANGFESQLKKWDRKLEEPPGGWHAKRAGPRAKHGFASEDAKTAARKAKDFGKIGELAAREMDKAMKDLLAALRDKRHDNRIAAESAYFEQVASDPFHELFGKKEADQRNVNQCAQELLKTISQFERGIAMWKDILSDDTEAQGWLDDMAMELFADGKPAALAKEFAQTVSALDKDGLERVWNKYEGIKEFEGSHAAA